jgi:uncharacterized membrane protein
MRRRKVIPTRFVVGSQTSTASPRGGIAVLWVILAVPAILTLFLLVLDVANLWLARIELRNALDAAALSGAKTWGEGGTTNNARTDAQTTAALNTVIGNTVTLSLNENAGATNGNSASTGDIILGTITVSGGVQTFNWCGTPDCPTGAAMYAVRTSATVSVESLFDSWFGTSFGPFDITSSSYAQYACSATGPPQLVKVDTLTLTPNPCP